MMHHYKGIAFAAAASAALASALPASADSRIFSVKTNQPGVTVEQAFRGDEALVTVGRGGNATLFRIDNSATTPVPCVNRVVFVTSTGENIDRAADFCALNWDLTLDVQAAEAPEPADRQASDRAPEPSSEPVEKQETPEAASSPAAPGLASDGQTYSQSVTVTTDDPGVIITEVFLDGEPVEITSRDGAAVQIDVAGGAEGINCQRTVGVLLSDGRRVASDANICLNNWSVEVAVAGEPQSPPAPPPLSQTPPPAAAGPTLPDQTTPGQTVQLPANPLPSSQYVWTFSDTEASAALILGAQQAEDTAFVASCVKQSGETTVALPNSTAVVNPGATISITLSAGTFSKTYQGAGSPINAVTGKSHPEVDIPITDPLWEAMIHETALVAAIAPAQPIALTLGGSAVPTRQFVTACQVSAAPPPSVAAPPAPGGRNTIFVSYRCGGGVLLNVTYDGNSRTALVNETGAPPLLLNWASGTDGARYVAGQASLVSVGSGVRWSRFGNRPLICRTQ